MPDRPFDLGADRIVSHVAHHSFWLTYLQHAFDASSHIGLHLAVFTEPYLSLVLEGRKTVESRFSRVRCPPFKLVNSGDVIFIKQAGGPIRGLALAKKAWFFELNAQIIRQIKKQYGEKICADEYFWRARRNASYATLIELTQTVVIPATTCNKRDRRGWVSLRSPQLRMAL